MSKTSKTMVVGAAMAGLFAGSYAVRATAATSATDTGKSGIFIQKMDDTSKGKHDCKGKNDCKGQGGCKSGDNGCKGKNDCKGKGGCSTMKHKKAE